MSHPVRQSSPVRPHDPQRPTFVAPRTPIEVEVAGVWEELFDTGPVGLDDDFFALGGTSLAALRMIERIGTRLHRTLPLDALVAGATVQRIARVLAHISPASESPLVRFRPGHGRPPLICVHPGGGSALCYLELARGLPASQPVYGFQEPAGLNARTIRRRSCGVVSPTPSGGVSVGPWHLAGHSFGGLVAFEISAAADRDGAIAWQRHAHRHPSAGHRRRSRRGSSGATPRSYSRTWRS